jgi:glycosyltransferase involved in cell wall biosynthesis
MNTESQRLVVIDPGIDVLSWTESIREIATRKSTLVLTERGLENIVLDQLGIESHSVTEHIPPHGALEAEILLTSQELLRTWISQAPLSTLERTLTYDGLSLWDMNSYGIGKMVSSTLKRIETLRSLFKRKIWNEVYYLEKEGTFAGPLTIAMSKWENKCDIQVISTHGDPEVGHCLRDWLLSGWKGQPLRDIYNGAKSRPLPSIRLIDRERPFLFLIDSYGTYLHTLLPVIQAVSSTDQVTVINTGGVIRSRELCRAEITLSYCSQYVPLSAWGQIGSQTQCLRRDWKSLCSDLNAQKWFEYKGHSLWPAMKGELRKYFLRFFPQTVVWIEALKHVFKTRQPRGLITVPDRHFQNRVAISLARRYEVPSLTVQAALISDHPRYWKLYADTVAVIDQYSRKVYVENGGVESDNVVVTGLPRWDRMVEQLRRVDHEIAGIRVREALGLDTEDRLIVLATQPLLPSHTNQMVRAVTEAVATFPDQKLIIKIHPRESIDRYLDLLGTFPDTGSDIQVIAKTDLSTLLAASEVLVTGFSNVALEAALLDKPVLIVNLTDQPDPLPFVENGIALGAYSEAEVEQKLSALLTDTSTREELRARRERYFDQNPQLLDGRATERVVALLKEMASYPTEK